jgi:hypothetical protein
MNAFIMLVLIAAPFVALAALITLLVVVIGSGTRGRG